MTTLDPTSPEYVQMVHDYVTNECGDEVLGYKIMPHHRVAIVVPQIFTSRLTYGQIGAAGYDDCWCYHTPEDALAAMALWNPVSDPEPSGWHRHPPSGRRRPDGDPAQEYVNL